MAGALTMRIGIFNRPPAGGPAPLATDWRINITATEGGNVAVAECEMRQTTGGADECTGGTTSASTVSGANAAANAFANDGTTTEWVSTNVAPQWLKYAFGATKTIEEVSITAQAGAFGSHNGPVAFDGPVRPRRRHLGHLLVGSYGAVRPQ